MKKRKMAHMGEMIFTILTCIISFGLHCEYGAIGHLVMALAGFLFFIFHCVWEITDCLSDIAMSKKEREEK